MHAETHVINAPTELLETSGLDLGYGVALPQINENPIDFDRLLVLYYVVVQSD